MKKGSKLLWMDLVISMNVNTNLLVIIGIISLIDGFS